MRTYGDLNLAEIRLKNDLDFAHFTYKSGMCSCCFGPEDLPKSYWRNRVILSSNNFTYILFVNACNGGGIKTKNDYIEDWTCVRYRVKDMTQIGNVSLDLQRQLGPEYCIIIPDDMSKSITIRLAKKMEEERIEKENKLNQDRKDFK